MEIPGTDSGEDFDKEEGKENIVHLEGYEYKAWIFEGRTKRYLPVLVDAETRTMSVASETAGNEMAEMSIKPIKENL